MKKGVIFSKKVVVHTGKEGKAKETGAFMEETAPNFSCYSTVSQAKSWLFSDFASALYIHIQMRSYPLVNRELVFLSGQVIQPVLPSFHFPTKEIGHNYWLPHQLR